eukprot:TRINITY_DN8722_c1_g1_i4.p1 TRINITY_DN8722_c1_g1~~TRINITY_DN8722_c1_g1_i4.p1  ORF type:complete len:1562 (+),score=724.49 TRINITY_DN8722_c1_g1_i4:63-4748(+)
MTPAPEKQGSLAGRTEPPAVFEVMIDSTHALRDDCLSDLRYRNVAEMLFCNPLPSDAQTVLLGAGSKGIYDVSYSRLRRAVLKSMLFVKSLGLQKGDTLCIARIPNTCELKLAVALLGAACLGVRVFLPMFTEVDNLEQWLRMTETKHVIVDRHEATAQGVDVNTRLLTDLLSLLDRNALACSCVTDDLGLDEHLLGEGQGLEGLAEHPLVAECIASTDVNTEFAIFTTSGSSGKSKLVLYPQGPFLRKEQAAAQHIPGVAEQRRMLSLLTHTQSVFTFVGALFHRQLILMVHVEWMFHRPESLTQLLLQAKVTHIVGGTGIWHSLVGLCRRYGQLKAALCKHLVLCEVAGNAFTPAEQLKWEHCLSTPFANAYGSTETLRVSGTFYDGPCTAVAHHLGNPFPYVRLCLRKAETGAAEGEKPKPAPASGGAKAALPVYELHVRSPYLMKGYITEEGLVRPGDYHYTGDCVTHTVDGQGLHQLHFVGRKNHDFLKNSMGVKVQRLAIQNILGRVLGVADSPFEHVECYPLDEAPGLGALFFLKRDHPLARQVAQPHHTPPTLFPGHVSSRVVLKACEAAVLRYNAIAKDTLDSLLVLMYAIQHYACVIGPAPRTATKQLTTAALVREVYGKFITGSLLPKWKNWPGVKRVTPNFHQNAFAQHSDPASGALQRFMNLDKDFRAGSGDHLSMALYEGEGDARGSTGETVQVLDLVGGFGCSLLGHSHPGLLQAAQQALQPTAPVPICDQFSAKKPAGELCRRLCETVGNITGAEYVCKLASTGAEAVEMALSHAMLEFRSDLKETFQLIRSYSTPAAARAHRMQTNTQREDTIRAIEAAVQKGPLRVLTLARAYHGKTSATRALIGKLKQRRSYLPMMGLQACPLEPEECTHEAVQRAVDACTLEFQLPFVGEDFDTPFGGSTLRIPLVLAAIAEPIQGEGGVREVSLDALRALSYQRFPLIVDEIQSGMGRSGSMLASAGVTAAYYTLGKAIGGGVCKLSACLIQVSRYRAKFDKHSTSTYANDAFSAQVGLKVLDILEEETICERVQQQGGQLKAMLVALQERYPTIIRAVTGRGLMLGVQFDTQSFQQTCGVLRGMVTLEQFGYVLSAYLLHEHRVRVLPTLSAPNTLRIQPSAYISDASISTVRHAFEQLAEVLLVHDTASLFCGCFTNEERLGSLALADDTAIPPELSIRRDAPQDGAAKVGFVAHYVYPEREIIASDRSFARLNFSALKAFASGMFLLNTAKPVPMLARNVMGGRVWFHSEGLMYDAFGMEEAVQENATRRPVAMVQRALRRCKAAGCDIVVLGAFTSIVTNNGCALTPPEGMILSTGNSLTAASACRVLNAFCAHKGVVPEVVAIIGATGNIGAAVSYLMYTHAGCRKLVLVSRSEAKLEGLKQAIAGLWTKKHPGCVNPCEISWAVDFADVREADVIMAMTATNTPIIFPKHISPTKPVIVSDVSVPNSVSAEARKLPNVTMVPFSGNLVLPQDPQFSIATHIETGTSFACSIEAMLLGLLGKEEAAKLKLIGDLDLDTVEKIDSLAMQHGFYDKFQFATKVSFRQ